MPFYRSWLKTQWRYLSMLSFTTVSTMPLSLLPTWRTHITQQVFLLRLPWEIFWVLRACTRSSVIEIVFPVPWWLSLMKPPPLGASKSSVWKCEPNLFAIKWYVCFLAQLTFLFLTSCIYLYFYFSAKMPVCRFNYNVPWQPKQRLLEKLVPRYVVWQSEVLSDKI